LTLQAFRSVFLLAPLCDGAFRRDKANKLPLWSRIPA